MRYPLILGYFHLKKVVPLFVPKSALIKSFASLFMKRTHPVIRMSEYVT